LDEAAGVGPVIRGGGTVGTAPTVRAVPGDAAEVALGEQATDGAHPTVSVASTRSSWRH
jgi:hypothetical protein